MKNVQIPLDLFLDIIDYLSGEESLKESIRTRLYKKIDSMIAREYFTKYKKSPPGEERETLRKKYLELAAKSKNCCSDHEIPYEKM